MSDALRSTPSAPVTSTTIPSNPSNPSYPTIPTIPTTTTTILSNPNPSNFSGGPTSNSTTTIPEENGRRQRSLATDDLEGLVRILSVSGRRLVECDGEWRVLPRGDKRRRSLMTVSAADVDRLKSEKLLVASVSGYLLSTEDAPEEQPAAGPWIFEAACVPAAKGAWRGFARLAELARHGRGPLSLRQALAGLRLIEDAEAAARDSLLTMNWDAVPSDRNTRSGKNGGLQPHAQRAARRIERIRAALGKRDFTIVYAACVERVHLKALEQRFGLKRLGARTVLPEALEKIAEVYDG
jgi:hypothetical protein